MGERPEEDQAAAHLAQLKHVEAINLAARSGVKLVVQCQQCKRLYVLGYLDDHYERATDGLMVCEMCVAGGLPLRTL
jgi:hypothetical protein